ncbi:MULTISPECIES: hypothetical protein [Ferrimonas]|uniref:hypothetical protein n=1 Tax=Ferrimonas TaxID=44011 RepID=UPI0003FDF5C1|nr:MULTISPECIES: hypothetical protein [Ferrimonas]USD38720.1 hypothetical protein J8Z22_06345 [Ferrimonas sp. SCSIO 43195]
MFPQSTLLDPLFWMLMGATQVLVFAGANQWFKELKLGMNAWKWGLVAGYWLSLVLTLAGAFTLMGENEGNAGWYLLGTVGLALVVAGVGLGKWLLYIRPDQR